MKKKSQEGPTLERKMHLGFFSLPAAAPQPPQVPPKPFAPRHNRNNNKADNYSEDLLRAWGVKTLNFLQNKPMLVYCN